MNDKDFLAALESCTLPESEFPHAGHVRAGYLYLTNHSFPRAVERMCSAVRAYARSLGKPDRYHETITVGFMVLINMHLHKLGDGGGWEGFKVSNPELFSKDALLQFYPRELLESPAARMCFVLAPRAATEWRLARGGDECILQ